MIQSLYRYPYYCWRKRSSRAGLNASLTYKLLKNIYLYDVNLFVFYIRSYRCAKTFLKCFYKLPTRYTWFFKRQRPESHSNKIWFVIYIISIYLYIHIYIFFVSWKYRKKQKVFHKLRNHAIKIEISKTKDADLQVRAFCNDRKNIFAWLKPCEIIVLHNRYTFIQNTFWYIRVFSFWPTFRFHREVHLQSDSGRSEVVTTLPARLVSNFLQYR